MDPDKPADSRLPLSGTVLTSVALAALVGLSARGHLVGPAAQIDPGLVRWIRIMGAVIAGGAVWRLLALHRIIGPPVRGPGRSVSVGTALITAALLMISLTSIALLTRPGSASDRPPLVIGPPDPQGRLPESDREAEGTTFSDPRAQTVDVTPVEVPLAEPSEDTERDLMGPEAMNRVLTILILMAMAWVIARSWAARSNRRPEEPELSPDDAERGLEDSLRTVQHGPGDFRAQITQAYLQLQRALGLAGAMRKPQEAPHEHLFRVLGPLGITAGPLHRLASLHVLAQFSEHPITEGHRQQAAEALSDSLSQLRAVRGGHLIAALETEAAAQ